MFRKTVPEELPEVDRTGATCRKHGHAVRSWGSLCGWCPRCEHSVHTGSGKVLYYGKFYRRVPPHDEAAEARTAEWAKSHVARRRERDADHAALDREQRQMFGIAP